MARFTELLKDLPEKDGMRPLVIAKDEHNREVLIKGAKSQQAVRDALRSGDELPGDVGSFTRGDTQRFIWSLPEENTKRRDNRDPIADLVGIAHHQAMELVFASRPPEDNERLSKFWESARPHIRKMAKEIAEDRLALQRDVAQKVAS